MQGNSRIKSIFTNFHFLAVILIISLAFFVDSRVGESVQDSPSKISSPIASFSNSDETSKNNSTSSEEESTTDSIPFEELTIPYHREREYESSLGELEEVSRNGDYVSYVTSYDSDGLRVNGQLTIPTNEEREGGYPAVVFVHGYIPPQEYDTFSNYNSYVDFLARQGLVVFKIDLRGHGDSEGNPGGAYYSGDYISDILNAHAALQSSDFVDPDRIGLWGHSMGGNVVFRSFVASSEVEKAVIWAGAVYTYVDFGEYSIDDNSYRPPSDDSPRRRERERLFETYGRFDPESEFWRMVPATNYLDGVIGSLQIHHATDDPVVDIRYSRNIDEILDGTGVSHEIFEYPSGGHNITGASFTRAMQRTADFLAE